MGGGGGDEIWQPIFCDTFHFEKNVMFRCVALESVVDPDLVSVPVCFLYVKVLSRVFLVYGKGMHYIPSFLF